MTCSQMWRVLCLVFGLIVAACQDPSPRILTGEDSEVGGIVHEEMGVHEQPAGELAGSEGGTLAGEEINPAGEESNLAGEQASSLSCVEGSLHGPMLMASVGQRDPDDERAGQQKVEENNSRQHTHHGSQVARGPQSQSPPKLMSLYGHHRLFRNDSFLSKESRSELQLALNASQRRYGLKEQLGLFSGTHLPKSWRPIEPIGQGFWLASIQGLASQDCSFGCYILNGADKWSHELPPLHQGGLSQELITARVTLWAHDQEELTRVLKHPTLALPLERRANLRPPWGDREQKIQVNHRLTVRNGEAQYPSLRWTTRPLRMKREEWFILVEHPRVMLVSPAEVVPQIQNAPSRDLLGTDRVTQPSFLSTQVMPDYGGWTGRGVRVGIMDSGIAVHKDFFEYDLNGEVVRDRIRGELPPSDKDGHGTTVAGILAGNGMASSSYTTLFGLPSRPFQWRGQAPEVLEIYSHLMYGTGAGREDPAWTQMFEEQNAHLANHSHTFGNGFYTPETQGYDAFISGVRVSEEQRENGALDEAIQFSAQARPAFLAAGNNGQSPRDNALMRLHGYYGLLVNLKNGIIVGSVNSNDAQHVDSSSMGPSLDGRIKPDVMAPGSSDDRPLSGMRIQLGEVRLHARRGSTSPDLVWRWGREHPTYSSWTGQGAFDLDEAEITEGILTAETFGSYYTRIRWDRSEGEKAINANQYSEISFEVRILMDDTEDYFNSPTPVGRHPRELSHAPPPVWMLRWGDDIGRGYDERRSLPISSEAKEGQWTRLRYSFDEDWYGNISRLRITPVIYRGGIFTTDIYGAYWVTSGTSMASPAAAGVGALALEQLTTEHEYHLEQAAPSPALLRGLMTHTARDLVRPVPPPRASPSPDTGMAPLYFAGPDFTTGFGLVDAEALSHLIHIGVDHPRWIDDEVNAGEVRRYELQVTDQGPLKVTLVWDDPPGSLMTPPWEVKLVHDLDLALVDENGKAYGPWVLTPPPLNVDQYMTGVDNLSLSDINPARRCFTDRLDDLWGEEQATQEQDAQAESTSELTWVPRGNQACLDHLNPIEEVMIPTPAAGRYTLLVRGAKEGGGRQTFSLIWSQACELTSPD